VWAARKITGVATEGLAMSTRTSAGADPVEDVLE
jgi:hypothetical protein